MAPDPENLISSGVEPVDKLRGGLQPGFLYLVQGTASDASLFAIAFLIEGLKRGETVALIMSYSPEDAVRRFALMGYDCLEDVYSGRLVLLEYTRDTIQQIAALSEFTPVLRELEWLLGETKPRRIVFDPVTTVLARKDQNLSARILQFSEWATKLGATFVLISPATDGEVVDQLRPFVADSFRFDTREIAGRTTRMFLFEKSPEIPPQQIEIDESRGVLLLGQAPMQQQAPAIDISIEEPDLPENPVEPASGLDLLTTIELESADEGPLVDHDFVITEEPPSNTIDSDIEPAQATPLESPQRVESETQPKSPTATTADRAAQDEFSEFVRDLMNTTSTLELGFLENPSRPIKSGAGTERCEHETPSARTATSPALPKGDSRAADVKIVATEVARAAESLLLPPAVGAAAQTHTVAQPEAQPESSAVDPGKFSILVVNDDETSVRAISHALAGYSLQFVHDGISALAKLLSFKPDLVVLDVDLPIVDGFKVLEHIRSNLNVPVVVISGSRVRAADRVLSSQLGADYFLTKPFSTRELSQKARQLIARHRGISAWIVTGDLSPERQQRQLELTESSPYESHFTAYNEFAQEVEKRVEAAMGGGAPFSVVGCRLPEITSGGGERALRLLEIIRGMARDSDVATTNPRNDFLILLPDATAAGARAFTARMRDRVVDNLKQEPTFWIRTFPESALAARAKGSAISQSEAVLRRRASDKSSPEIGGPAGERRQSTAMRAATS